MLAVTLGACSTPANRRELYNVSEGNSGPWHDYSRRRQAEAETGISGGVAPAALPGRTRSTLPPAPSGTPGPLPEPTLQSPMSPAAPPPAAVPPPAATDPALAPIDAGGTTAPAVAPPADTTTPPAPQ